MPKFYCEYCGLPFVSISQLSAAPCLRHPYGPHAGKHKLYEGGEKSVYTCKYCGMTAKTLSALVLAPCSRHPKGFGHKHSPAL